MAYKAVKNFYIGNTLVSIDQLVDIKDQAVADELLADGHIVKANEGGSESSSPLVDSPVVSEQELPKEEPSAPEQPVEPQPVTVEPQPVQPTPEQIQQDLQAAEGISIQ